jgi:hypothetical protein
MFAYFYPPLGGPGVQRPVKLIKYLDRNNWKTDVITVKDIMFHSSDDQLAAEDMAEKVIRTGSLDLMSFLGKMKKGSDRSKVYFGTPEKYKKVIRNLFPIDDKIGWLPYAKKAGRQLLKTKRYNAIMATIGPYTSGLAAYKLSRQYKIPLIIDYRDHWTMNPYIKFITPFHKRISENWEKRILKHASVITTVSKTMKSDLLQKFGSQLLSKIKVMYNGWDEEDFSDVPVREKTKKIIIRYIGNFYGHRTPKFFIQALENLKYNGSLPEDIQIDFIGNYYHDTADILKNTKISENINIIPQVNHKKSNELLMNCDGLLLFVATHKGKGVLTGKLFEYLRSGKEILAMIPPDGEAAEILKHYNYRFITSMENTKEIEEQFIEFYKSIKTNRNINNKIPAEYNRNNQTKEFISFVEGRL